MNIDDIRTLATQVHFENDRWHILELQKAVKYLLENWKPPSEAVDVELVPPAYPEPGPFPVGAPPEVTTWKVKGWAGEDK